MKSRIKFLIAIFGVALILISSVLVIYFKTKTEEVWEVYDTYVFSIFWPSTSCTTKYTDNYECFQRIKNLSIEKYFIVHGLWPSYLNGSIPDPCNKDSSEQITPKFEGEFLDKMEKNWPGLYSGNDNFWLHEYNKHGYCYIQRYYLNVKTEYKKYFEKVLTLFNNGFRNLMEDVLPDSLGVYNISTEKFRNYFYQSPMKLEPNKYALICDDVYNQLAEVRFAYDMNFNLIDVKKIANDSCKEYFVLNFTDTSKIPVYKKYDFYVFSLLWHPTNCKLTDKNCYKIIKQKELNTFNIHGLWPSYTNGKIPQSCNLGMDIEIIDDGSELFNKLNQNWFSVRDGDNKYFWKIEYNKHGYCYVQKLGKELEDYNLYFEKVMNVYNDNNVKDIFKDIYSWIFPGIRKLNRTYLEPKLNEKFGENTYTLYCTKINNDNFLAEFRLKFDLDFKITTKGESYNNCPEEFYAEFIEVEGEQKQDYGIAENFNIYMYSILWHSTTCKKKGYQCYDNLAKVPKNIWGVHGLWPNYKNATLPDWCNGKNDIEIEIKNQTLLKLMQTYWISGYHTNEYFWGHEFNKHGYCYNQRNKIDLNDYETYFQKALDIYFKYDFKDIFIKIYGDNIKPGDREIKRSDIENHFEKIGLDKYTYLLVCENISSASNINITYISEIRIRFNLDYTLYKNETDKSEFDCPETFMAEFL